MAASTVTWRMLPAPLLLITLLAVSPLLRFYANNLHEGVSAQEIAGYAALWLLGVLIVYVVGVALLRPSTSRSTAVFAVTLFACGSYYDLASRLSELGASYTVQNLGWLAALGLLVAAALRFGASERCIQFLWLFAAGSVLVPTLAIASHRAPDSGPGLPLFEAFPLDGNPVWSGRALRTPNLYWLVVDSYPNGEVLRTHYRFDNDAFLSRLRARGFEIAEESYANFSTTRLSVPTTLDMQYVVEAGERYSEDRGAVHVRLPGRTNSGMIAAVAGDNRTVAYLRQLGYRSVHFEGNSFHLTRCRGLEDHCIEGDGLSELQLSLLSLLPIRPLVGLLTDREPGLLLTRPPSPSGTGIPELAEALAKLPVDPPFFVYAHFASPHPPFFNDAECRRSPDNYPLNPHQFTQQLVCVNRQLEALLDQLERDDPDAIIVLSSDHGPRMSVAAKLPTRALKAPQIRESLGILNAFKLPKQCRSAVYPTLSPVNSMRVVFACLGGHAPRLLADRHFIARPSADRGVIRAVEVP